MDETTTHALQQAAQTVLSKFVNAASASAAAQIFDQNRDSLARPAMKGMLTASIRGNATNERAVSVLQARWDMLDRFLEVGTAAALAGYPAVVDAVEQFVNKERGRPLVMDTTAATLLSREANWVFADLLLQPRTDDECLRILSQWKALGTLRSGVGLTFSPLPHPTVSTSAPSGPGPALRDFESLLRDIGQAKGYGRALFQLKLANLYEALCENDRRAIASIVIANLEEALISLVGDDDYNADRRRNVRIELSRVYLDATDVGGEEYLRRAGEHLRVAERQLLDSHLVGLDQRVTEELFRTYLNLAAVYQARAHFEGKIINLRNWRVCLATQIRAFRAARRLIPTGMVSTRSVAILYRNFADVSSTLGRRKRAVAYYLAAFEASESTGDLDLRASLDHDLGDELAKMETEQPGANLLGEEHLRRALAFYDAASHSKERLRTLRSLGRLLFEMHEWSTAETVFAEAIALTEVLLPKIADSEARRIHIEENEDIFARLAFCLLRLGKTEEGVAALEQGKSRLAAERFGHDKGGDESPSLLDAIPPHGAAIMFLAAPAGGAALVATADTQSLTAENIVWFENEMETTLRNLVFGPDGWVNSYLSLASKANSQWEEAIDRLMKNLWSFIVQPIYERLSALGVQKGAELLVFPHGWLASLPLHCAFRLVNGQRRYAVDDFAFRYVPSLGVLEHCRRRVAQNSGKGATLLAIVDPRSDLPGATCEGEKVSEIFVRHGTTPIVLKQKNASLQNVLMALPHANYVLFSCHGQFNRAAPALSALLLAGDTRLRLSEIEEQADALTQVRLVVLSACESGITSLHTPDEFVGFPAAFLDVGAPGVISSLWRVDDASTAVLISSFYAHLLDVNAAMSPAQALRQAQLDICSLRPKELDLSLQRELSVQSERVDNSNHRLLRDRPYLWGAFAMFGA